MSSQEKIKQIKDMVNSYKLSHLIMAAYDLGIFNNISTEPMLIKDIALKLKLELYKIEPILNALVFYKILSKNSKGYYLDYYNEVLNPNEELNQLGYISFAKTSMDKWNTLANAIKSNELALANFNELTTK